MTLMTQNENKLSNTPFIGAFDLGNGTFSPEATKRSAIRSVVVSVQEDKGQFFGLCPTQIMLPFSYGAVMTETTHIESGRDASLFLKQEAKKLGIELPAVDFCLGYEGFGVTKGMAFLPSKAELSAFAGSKLLSAFRKLGLTRTDNTFLTSSLSDDHTVWMLSLTSMSITGWVNPYRTCGVMPMIEVQL